MTLEALRRQFPHVREQIYVNHAATGPLSRPVMQAIEAYLEERHRTQIENYEAFQPVVEATKGKVARLLSTEAARVEFVQNTSSALDILARGIDWQAGDRIAVPGCEFPANVYPFMNLRRHGVEVDFIPHEESTLTLEAVEEALRPRTRLLTLSWVQFLSGFRADLEAVGRLCAERGVLFCVDAIQGLGALRLDAETCGIDFLACGGHKWLMAAQGIGILYVTEALQGKLAPPAGWFHGPVDWDNFFDYELSFYPDARRFRLGMMNHVGIASLGAALDLYFEAGPRWCEAQVMARACELSEGFAARGLKRYGTDDPAHASGIVTVAHPQAEALYEHLRACSITGALRNGLLRFSPTYYNTPAEMAQVIEAVADFEKMQVTS